MELSVFEKTSNKRFSDLFSFKPTHPITGEIMDFTVTIRAKKSDECRQFLANTLKKQVQERYQKERQGKTYIPDLENGIQANTDYACVLVDSLDGLTKDGEPYSPTKQEIKDILTNQEWLVMQIIGQADDDANFLIA